jgi:cyclophilin family peptidyl-prolyl cis-trans isomerase
VGTTKRERQKANRQKRLEELARQARVDKTKKRGALIAGIVVVALVVLFVSARLFSSDESSSAVSVTLAPGTTSAADSTTSIVTDTSVGASTTTSDPNATSTVPASTTTTTLPFTYGTAACANADGSSTKPAKFDGAPKLCIDPTKTYTAVVTTNKGAFTITLDAKRFPGNVNNFVNLARFHYYDATGCHRVIKDFVVQCGRPGTDETAPGYTVNDELPAKGDYALGVVAVANTGKANTGGGQFYVITGAQGVALPPQYSILGKVTAGYDSTVSVLAGLADPLASNGVPPLVPISITSITVSES